jgi:hypothetical protein
MLEKSKNIFLCLLFPFILVSKIENPKIFVVLLWFCKVLLQSSVPHDSVGAWYSLYIIQATKVKKK